MVMGLTDSGDLVGTYNTPPSAGPIRNVVYHWSLAEGLIELDSRLDPALGLTLTDASAVNEAGQILASTDAGLVLLTPQAVSSAPVVAPIEANATVAIGEALVVSANFTDPDAIDTFTAQWDWGDGNQSAPDQLAFSNGSGKVTGSHVFTTAGVHQVTLTLTDSASNSVTTSREVVVFDPSGSSVSGTGLFPSPVGADLQDPSRGGVAVFALTARYPRAGRPPSGLLTFNVVGSRVNLIAVDFDWLAVYGSRAQVRGSGLLNGKRGYQFAVTAIDGPAQPGQKTDRLRVRIWSVSADGAEQTVYDNQIDPNQVGSDLEGSIVSSGNLRVQS